MKKSGHTPYILLALTAFLVYGRCLGAGFIVVDDYRGYVNNEAVHSLGLALVKLNINTIVNALIYPLGGKGPFLPHFVSVALHSVNVCLAYALFSRIGRKQVAFVGALLFAVHPVTSESVCWVSGRNYLWLTQFGLWVLIAYTNFVQTKNINKYYLSLGLNLVFLIVFRNVWMVTIPLILIFFDQFILRKKFERSLIFLYLPYLYILPVLAILPMYGPLSTSISDRMLTLQTRGQMIGNAVVHSQESLRPIIEGYPFVVYSMLRIYIFPNNLMFYHDGNPLSHLTMFIMYAVFVAYIVLLLILSRKSRKLMGLALLPPLSALYSFSPVKFTWYVAERYFYFGSIFFSFTLAYIIFRYIKDRRTVLVLVSLLTILLGIRTFVRTGDWFTATKHAEATIRSSPGSYRGYLDLALVSKMDKDYEMAISNYYQSLQYFNSAEAKHEVGDIFLKQGPKYLAEIEKFPSPEDASADEYMQSAEKLLSINAEPTAVFFTAESLKLKKSARAYNFLAEIYLAHGQLGYAEEMLLDAFKLEPENVDSMVLMGALLQKKGEAEEAGVYFNNAEELEPENNRLKLYSNKK